MEAVYVRFYRMNVEVKLPERAHEIDACWDIFANASLTIPPGVRVTVSTGLKAGLLPGWELQIRPKSGLASFRGITIVNTPGTIDAGYRGEIMVILLNTGVEPFEISRGDKIAQMALKPVYNMKILEVDSVDELGQTDRGEGGFGSTGE